jgi:hypothetical protein
MHLQNPYTEIPDFTAPVMQPLTTLEKDVLLLYLAQHLTMEQRHTLMVQQPHIYNKWVGREVMRIRKA